MKYVLATIDTESDETLIRGIGAVSRDIWDGLRSAIVDLDLLQLQRANHVRINHRRYQSLVDDLAGRPEEIVAMPAAGSTSLHGELETAFIAFVLSIRLYLEHAEASLTRKYGPKSARHIEWTTMVSAKYDACFSYRFMYRLRNYVAHSSTRGLAAHVRAHQEGEEGFNLKFEHIAQPSVLVDAWSGWGPLRTEIATYEVIDLPTHADQAMQAVLEIEHATTLIYGPELTEALGMLQRIRRTVCMYQGPLYLITTGDDFGLETMSILPIPPMPAEAELYRPGEFPRFRRPAARFQMDESTTNIRVGLLEFVTKEVRRADEGGDW